MYTGVTRAAGTADNVRPEDLGSGRNHPNALMLRHAHSSFQAGNLEALFSLFADDITWVLPGDNALSGVFVGREGVMRNFAQLQANVDTYWAQGIDYFGSDDHAVLVAKVSATRGDKSLECLECLLFKVVDGKFTHCWHMALDDKAWDAFFPKP
jgi:ketosteroid isomerase-like protein